MSPSTQLTALTAVTPVIDSTTLTLSIDTTVLPYTFQTDTATTRLEIRAYGSVFVNTDFTVVDNTNQFSGVLELDTMTPSSTVQVVGRNYDPADLTATNQLVTPTLSFALLYTPSGMGTSIGAPSGVSAYRSTNTCRVEWVKPTYDGFLGVRVQVSTDAAGVNPPFTAYGDLVTTVTRRANTVLGQDSSTSTSIDDTGKGTSVTTTTATTQAVEYSSVDIPFNAVNADQFYVVLSTVIQDPQNQTVFESNQNGPVACGFVNLKQVSPTDFLALQRKEDVASRLISYITKNYPDLDLSPRSELRDLFIDPFAIELANMSVREWFSRCSTSISAMAQLDDSTGSGASDTFAASPVKQQVARAYGLNATDTQRLIDRQFDILGEQAGIPRGTAQASSVDLTFFTYTKPTQTVTISTGINCVTVADTDTPSLTFRTTGSATISPTSTASFFDPAFGWWAVTVPAQCLSLGSSTNVGAGTIRSISTSAPAGWSVTNLARAQYGTDNQSNSDYAAIIAARLVTGVDSGTRNGYKVAALSTPGIVSATVVAAGDVEMLRDWDDKRQKHVFGAVDIYVRGASAPDEQADTVAYSYQNTGVFGQTSTYLKLSPPDSGTLRFTIQNFTALDAPIYAGLELAVVRPTGTIYLGLQNAQFDNDNGYIILSDTDMPYQYSGDAVTTIRTSVTISGTPVNNRTLITNLSSQGSTIQYLLLARKQSSLLYTPELQPVLSISSIVGAMTGQLPTSAITLIQTSNFLLEGGSNRAGCIASASALDAAPTTSTITALVNGTVLIDDGMDVEVDSNGKVLGGVTVLSSDQSMVYSFGVDYTVVPQGVNRSYALQILPTTLHISKVSIADGVATFTSPNSLLPGASVVLTGFTSASFLNNQTVTISGSTAQQFTANFLSHPDYTETSDNGIGTTTAITDQQQVVVSYNKYTLCEEFSRHDNVNLVLTGSTPTQFTTGFVKNIWLPEFYGDTTLLYDGAGYATDGTVDLSQSTGLVGALIPRDSRYIKVLWNGIVMREGLDFSLAVDPVSGAASLTRIEGTGRIPSGAAVLVSYYTTEVFTVTTKYPAYVSQLAAKLDDLKHAAADVLVKAMIANPIDVTMAVTLDPNADPSVLDPQIRTAIDLVLDTSEGKLYQSEVIRQVKAIPGVTNVAVPLTKCAKSDGAYDIGVVIPTATSWLKLSDDPAFQGISGIPANAYISAAPVLPDNTIPSGGQPNAFVGLLYEGEDYRRATSVQDFLNNSGTTTGSFYIVGVGDRINPTKPLDSSYSRKVIVASPVDDNKDVIAPGLRSYLVTYQVFNEGGKRDIDMSSTEYFVPGNITIVYESEN